MKKNFIVTVKIVPNSSRNEVVKEDEFIKIKITAPPIENKANKLLIEFLSKKLDVAKSKISILRGENSKFKTLAIEEIDYNYFISHLL